MQSTVLTLWCVLIVGLMPIVCAGIAKWGSFGKPRRQGGYNNHDPREWLAQQQGYRKRANAAQSNCFEALPLFIGAVVLALHLQAPLATVNTLALAFVGLRILYVLLYLADRPTPRSLVWVAAMGVNVALLFSGV
ncbi:MAG: MAPEG family protein [Burkholderiales bacterium]